MQTTADAIQMDRYRADERMRRQVAAQPIPCDLAAFDKPRTGRDRVVPSEYRGPIVVGIAWLAFYVITAVHHFISSGN